MLSLFNKIWDIMVLVSFGFFVWYCYHVTKSMTSEDLKDEYRSSRWSGKAFAISTIVCSAALVAGYGVLSADTVGITLSIGNIVSVVGLSLLIAVTAIWLGDRAARRKQEREQCESERRERIDLLHATIRESLRVTACVAALHACAGLEDVPDCFRTKAKSVELSDGLVRAFARQCKLDEKTARTSAREYFANRGIAYGEFEAAPTQWTFPRTKVKRDK